MPHEPSLYCLVIKSSDSFCPFIFCLPNILKRLLWYKCSMAGHVDHVCHIGLEICRQMIVSISDDCQFKLKSRLLVFLGRSEWKRINLEDLPTMSQYCRIRAERAFGNGFLCVHDVSIACIACTREVYSNLSDVSPGEMSLECSNRWYPC